MSAEIGLAGQTLHLLPERAAFWPANNAVLLADVHLGKDQVFRRFGMPVPAGVLAADLARIDALLAHTGAGRLIVLGDWIHAPPRDDEAWPAQVTTWRERHDKLAIDLVLGNHDRAMDAWLTAWGMRGHCPNLNLDGLCLAHEWSDAVGQPGISGHLHPGAVLKHGRQRLRLPAFLLGADHLVLPAFGRFTGLMDQTPFPAEQCWVIAGERVLPAPIPKSRIRA